MLIMPKRKSTFNFYESFSDLVFCALVMFLVLVLFLAMNVNQKQEQVEVDLQEVSRTRQLAEEEAELARIEAEKVRAQLKIESEKARKDLLETQRLRLEALAVRDTELAEIEKQRQKILADAQKLMQLEREQIAAERKRILAERAKAELERQKAEAERAKARAKAEAEAKKAEAEFEVRRSKLAEMERDLDRQRRLYEQALGANRFMGLPATPRLVVAYDWQPNRIAVHLVPDWLVAALNTTPAGLDAQALAAYYADQRERFMQQAKLVEPLKPSQYRALVRAVSVGQEPVPTAGSERRMSLDVVFALDDQGVLTNEAGIVIPGGNAQAAGVKVGDTMISLGDQPITPGNVAGLLTSYNPGDKVRLLVRRQGKPMVLSATFKSTRVVQLVEAYRTDLSMVISGALDTDYTYLWEPARADALRTQLQQGKAAAAVWQGNSAWEGRASAAGRPVLQFDVAPGGRGVTIGGEMFSIKQFRRVLESLGGGGIVVEYTAKKGPDELPEALYEQALRPTGFVIRAPQLDKLLKESE